MSAPSVQTPTSAIERANRLMSLRANPGFRDAFLISEEIVNTLTATAIDYPGWDMQQLMVLKSRAQAAKEHHDLLFAKIQEAISEGIQAQAAQGNQAEKTPIEILEQGDYVRQAVLTRFKDLDNENRPAGSY
jgi:hypothetical protein